MFDDNYIGNWIDDAVKSARLCLRLGFNDEQTIEVLQKSNCPDDMLSLILASAKILHADEVGAK
jgi:hypothetical protein